MLDLFAQNHVVCGISRHLCHSCMPGRALQHSPTDNIIMLAISMKYIYERNMTRIVFSPWFVSKLSHQSIQ